MPQNPNTIDYLNYLRNFQFNSRYKEDMNNDPTQPRGGMDRNQIIDMLAQAGRLAGPVLGTGGYSGRIADVNLGRLGTRPIYMPEEDVYKTGMSPGKSALLRRSPLQLMRNMLIGDDALLAKSKLLPEGQIGEPHYVPGVGVPLTRPIIPKSTPAANVMNIVARETNIPIEEIYRTILAYTGGGYSGVKDVRRAISGIYRPAGRPQSIQISNLSSGEAMRAIRDTEVLSSLIEASPPYQGHLYRRSSGVRSDGWVDGTIPPDEFVEGGQFEAPVLSFSTRALRGGAMITVLEPGAKAFPIKGISAFPEYEVLAGGRFVIRSISKLPSGITVVRVRQAEPPSMATLPGYNSLKRTNR